MRVLQVLRAWLVGQALRRAGEPALRGGGRGGWGQRSGRRARRQYQVLVQKRGCFILQCYSCVVMCIGGVAFAMLHRVMSQPLTVCRRQQGIYIQYDILIYIKLGLQYLYSADWILRSNYPGDGNSSSPTYFSRQPESIPSYHHLPILRTSIFYYHNRTMVGIYLFAVH